MMNEAKKAFEIIEAKGIKVGDRIRIIELKDDPDTRYNGMEGEITIIDSMGQLHGTWAGWPSSSASIDSPSFRRNKLSREAQS